MLEVGCWKIRVLKAWKYTASYQNACLLRGHKYTMYIHVHMPIRVVRKYKLSSLKRDESFIHFYMQGVVYTMKFAFSTLGCPDFSWPDIYSMADLGYSGIEIRGRDIFAVQAQPFTGEQLNITIENLIPATGNSLPVLRLLPEVSAQSPEKADSNYSEILRYIQLAHKHPYVRIWQI